MEHSSSAKMIGQKRKVNAPVSTDVRFRSWRLWMLIIMLVAATLRLYGLNNLSPPGLAHDEVANWLIDRAILDGDHAIYFTDAYGHEAGFHYLQAAFIALLGDHALALRLPAAFSGLLLVAVCFALARRLFNIDVAVTASALLAVLFWPVFFSRLGLRAIALPLVAGLSAYFWWRGWGAENGQDRRPIGSGDVTPPSSQHRVVETRYFLLAGLFAGLSVHTYMAARAVPIFYALLVLYLAIFHGRLLKHRWRNVLLFWIVFAVIAAPLAIYLQTNPGSEFRISEIDAPLRALMKGDLRPVATNSIKVLAMFGFAGDPLWRQNVAGSPVFEPLMAMIFYLSLPYFFLRFRDSRYAFLSLWLIVATTPSLVTIDAPSAIRIINILPVLTIFPASVIHNSGWLSTIIRHLSTETARSRIRLGVLVVILYTIGLTSRSLFRVWPSHDEVQFVWQAILAEVSTYLDDSSNLGPVDIGGWTPDTMDPPTMVLYLKRDDLALSHFDPTNTLIVSKAAETSVRILHPTILALNPLFVQQLKRWGATPQRIEDFMLYELAATPPLRPQFPIETLFDDELRFLGYDLIATGPTALEIITYWQAVKQPESPRRIFLHLVDESGNLLLEDYALDKADTRSRPHWQAGDIILQHHSLNLETAGLPPVVEGYRLRLGIFDPNSCPPLPCNNLRTSTGAEYLVLQIDVQP